MTRGRKYFLRSSSLGALVCHSLAGEIRHAFSTSAQALSASSAVTAAKRGTQSERNKAQITQNLLFIWQRFNVSGAPFQANSLTNLNSNGNFNLTRILD